METKVSVKIPCKKISGIKRWIAIQIFNLFAGDYIEITTSEGDPIERCFVRKFEVYLQPISKKR